MENQENAKKTDAETDKTERFSAQVNLVKGSPKHQQIIRIGNEMGAVNSGDVVKRLMDAYENPPKDADSAATIERLEQQVSDLKAENAAYEATLQNNENEIAQLKLDLAAARNDANANAAKAQGIELAQQGAIVIKPNPVVAYFLEEMAKETGKTPADILQALYIDDLQNPRANNLPYTVPASRIREVMAELKKQQNI